MTQETTKETKETQVAKLTFLEEMQERLKEQFTETKISLFQFQNVQRINGEIATQEKKLEAMESGKSFTFSSEIEKVEVSQISENDLGSYISEQTRALRINFLKSEIDKILLSQIEIEKEKDFAKNATYKSNSNKLKDLNSLLIEIENCSFFCFQLDKEKKTAKSIGAKHSLLINNIDFNEFFKPFTSWRTLVKENEEIFKKFGSTFFKISGENKGDFQSLSTVPFYKALQNQEIRNAFEKLGVPKITSLKLDDKIELTF